MALQTNLNKKDKITIAVLLFAAAVFMVVWFLIKPTITTIIATDEKIEQAEVKQTQYKNKIMNLASGEVLYTKTVDDFNASTEKYYKIMDSSEIDKMVTSYVLKSGLFSENLTINMPTDSVEESPYIYSEISSDIIVDSDSTGNTSTNGNDSLLTPYLTARTNTNTTASSGVQSVGLTLVVTGSRKACQSFIDDICSKPAVRITSFSWSEVDKLEVYNEETGVVELKDSGKVRLTVSFNLYMADVADYSTAVSDSAA